ncbi:sulfite exporter TauE/SafE family protein [Candidatus Bipolaricaulota bacterium]|nr:sulfite exporter TauE/SafE family protein [Candidatus Bipolaricaulota bacterium]
MTARSIVYLFIGLFSGFMSGLFGIGGGSVRIPLLNLVGLPLLNAFGINLLVIPFSSSVGALSQRRNIDKRIALYMITGGTLGSVTGAFLAGLISTLALAVIFVVVSVITVVGIYLDRIIPALARKISPGSWNIIAGSLGLSLIIGVRGGSGGSLFPPFLRAMKLNIHKAIATSLFVTIFTATAAVIIYWDRGDIVWLPAVFVLIGSMIGARIGSRISLKTKPTWLEIGLTILVIALAFITVYKAL